MTHGSRPAVAPAPRRRSRAGARAPPARRSRQPCGATRRTRGPPRTGRRADLCRGPTTGSRAPTGPPRRRMRRRGGAEICPGPNDLLIEVGDVLGRHEQLPAELTRERDAQREGLDRPTSIRRASRNGQASADTSSSVRRESSSRERGPAMCSVAQPEVTSVTTASAGSPERSRPRCDAGPRSEPESGTDRRRGESPSGPSGSHRAHRRGSCRRSDRPAVSRSDVTSRCSPAAAPRPAISNFAYVVRS